MKLRITYFLIFLGLKVFSQSFGSNGATWYYSVSSVLPPATNSPVQITSSLPFIFNNDTCHTITINGSHCSPSGSYMIHESNDSVYYYLTSSNRFVMLYNFNALPGDTQTIYCMTPSNTDTSFQLLVTSIGTMNINGFIRKTYSATPLDSYFHFGGLIIEGIGSTFFLFPQYGFCDPNSSDMRCYEDSIIGLYDLQPSIACDSTIWLGMDKSMVNEKDISIFPNPFTSSISISDKNQKLKKEQITLKDTFGQTVLKIEETEIKNGTITLDLNGISSGIYFLELYVDGQHAMKKIVKQ